MGLRKPGKETSAILALLFSNYAVFGVRTVSGMVVAGILGPEKRGVWSALALLLSYTVFFSLGAIHAMGRQIPILLGKGDHEAIARHKNTSVTFILISHSVVGLGMASYAFFFHPFSDLENKGIIYISGLVPMSGLVQYCLTVFRAEQKYKLFSLVSFIEGMSYGVLTILGAWLLDLEGMYIAVLLAWLVSLAVCIKLELKTVRLGISWSTLWEVLKHGFPLGMITYTYVIFQSIDRWVILGNISTKALGLYTIGVMLNHSLLILPNSILQYIAPKALHGFGKAGSDSTSLKKYVNDPLYLQSSIMTIAIPLGMVALYGLLRWFLPAYQEGYLAGLIVCVAAHPIMLPRTLSIVLSAEGHFGRYIAMLAAALGLNFLTATWLVEAGFGMEGVAASTVLTFTFYGIAMGIYVPRRYFKEGWGDLLRRLARYYWPMLVCGLVIVADQLFGVTGLLVAALLACLIGAADAWAPARRILAARHGGMNGSNHKPLGVSGLEGS
jgi:O-antigen/teichoic acid export membrane protein